jgi:SAM-dependent methyltransferase
MNREQRAKWEARHRAEAAGLPEPSIIEMLAQMPRGMALDVAAGTGRNAIALAHAGYRVIAADFSVTAMRSLAETARANNLPIMPVIADLEVPPPFRLASFDVVINVSFLDRALLSHMKCLLRIGGVLFFDTFLIDQAEFGHPHDPNFLLRHYELREMLSDMELIHYREGLLRYPDAKCAWRATALARRTA